MVLGLLSVLQANSAHGLPELDEATLRRYKDEAQVVAKGVHKNIEGAVSVPIDNNQFKENIAYGGTDIEGAGFGIEAAEDKGRMLRDVGSEGKCTNKNCDVSSISSTTAMLERDKKIEEAGFIKNEDGTVTDNKGYLDKPRAAAREAAAKFDFLTGSYADCKADDNVTKVDTYEVCDEYYDIKHDSCSINQVVEIDPRYNYECYKKREIKEKKCSDVITKLTCKQSDECNSGGIVLGSMQGDVAWVQHSDMLTFGTIADNNWRGSCAVFDRETTFEVKNKKLVKEFKLEEVGFDDYLQIKINDQQVYNGPFGGNKLEVTKGGGSGFFTSFFSSKVDTGNGQHSCELGTNWRRWPNIDLLPYLQEGENKIKIRVVVSGLGEFWMKIRAKQYCCTEWQEEREETCAYLD